MFSCAHCIPLIFYFILKSGLVRRLVGEGGGEVFSQRLIYRNKKEYREKSRYSFFVLCFVV